MSRDCSVVGKGQRLTNRAAYQTLNKQGRSWGNRLLILKALPNSSLANRYGLSVGKAVGKAACRNRVKRRLRENIRRAHLKQGWDILIIARPPTADSSFQEMQGALMQLLGRAGLLVEQT